MLPVQLDAPKTDTNKIQFTSENVTFTNLHEIQFTPLKK